MRIKKGDIVAVWFRDHVEDPDEHEGSIEFIVYGRVERVTRKEYFIGSWVYAKPNKHDDNEKWFVIVRSAINRIQRLEEQP